MKIGSVAWLAENAWRREIRDKKRAEILDSQGEERRQCFTDIKVKPADQVNIVEKLIGFSKNNNQVEADLSTLDNLLFEMQRTGLGQGVMGQISETSLYLDMLAPENMRNVFFLDTDAE
ncbi:hypothetical protein [Pseudovibrio sp. Ad37]|uniref:hypothetical protein n=1 Tax=Pseudovibrio sp. Ad37 TaxID=989422 RepID=UPI0007AE9220|nr:hypothetical protein [Pseudovibrio sp. Ad37]KZL26493.1 hypothetical protein PsAD37_01814 [Pseudovibrio sp. Ad37]